MEFLHDPFSFHCISRDHQSSFLVPFPTEFLKSMGVRPFTYCQHLLFVEWFLYGETADEQGVWEDCDVLVIMCSLVIVGASR